MRGTRIGGLALSAVLGVLGGCAGDGRIKPPRPEHEYVLPPSDSRFSSYPQYPEKTLNQFERKKDDDLGAGPGGPGGGSRGMGRGGMGMGGPGGAGGP